MRNWTVATICAISLTACMSGQVRPPPPRTMASATVKHTVLPVDDKADVTYLARGLMPGRFQTASAVYSGASDKRQGGSPASGAAVGAATAAMMGQSPVSSGGVATVAYANEAVSLLSGLAGERSAAVQIGRVYLPDTVNGISLASEAQAREFVRQEVWHRVEEYGRLTGRMVSCFDQCDSFFPTYTLTKAVGPAWHSYDPPALYVTFYLRKPWDKRRSTDAVLDKILTYPLAWEEPCFISLTSTPPTGGHKVVDGESVPEFPDMSSFSSPLERTLLRVLTKGGLFTFGAQNWQQFAWNGRVFKLDDPTPASLIQYEIAPETDRD
jgi:hypothetical protein